MKGYQTFEEIIEREGEVFLFSCWNNQDCEKRIQVANHQNFLHTLEYIEIGLNDNLVCQIYNLEKMNGLQK